MTDGKVQFRGPCLKDLCLQRGYNLDWCENANVKSAICQSIQSQLEL